MDGLQIAVGDGARTMLCDAFANAKSAIDAEYFSISDRDIVASLNDAAARGVHVRLHVEGHPDRYDKSASDAAKSERALRASLRRLFPASVDIVVEDDPMVLTHCKAAVVDGATAYVGTTNPTWFNFENPGAVVVKDSVASDVAAVTQSIEHQTLATSDRIVAGPSTQLRGRLCDMLSSSHDLSIASEDLSDPQVVGQLVERRAQGRHDRVLVGDRASSPQRKAISWLEHSGVEVHTLAWGFMHEKYVDDGDAFYIGSANLTHNGIDESHEIGILARAADTPGVAATLRSGFDRDWTNSRPA
ncbi:MAG TPA: phosphatidylserine/phosphatidylglycerophosphate/cardiolipin synthase family protein [Candidatus Acidoferrales bacterium]|nr:phosphatidylserine/phosphatidylglycerophosphate/cardiolipin synthase family protein [Candidatus Acidoferrales bacterium]